MTIYGAQRAGGDGRVAAIRVRSVRQIEIDPEVLGEPRGPGGPRDKGPKQGGGDVRGDCAGYTYAVRRRHREAIWAIEPSLLPRRMRDGRIWFPCSFLTLTLPERLWATPPARWKHWLDLWWAKVARRWPDAFGVWGLEFQHRGGPHFHILARWPSERDAAGWRRRQKWLSKSWAATVAGRGAPIPLDHLRAGTNLKPVVGPETIAEYLAKPGETEGKAPPRRLHVAHAAAAEAVKRTQKTAPVPRVGRWWGIVGRDEYARCKVVLEAELPAQTAARIAVALQVDWERWSERKGFEPKHWPKWASGEAVERIIAEAGANLELWAADWIDPATGELLPASEAAVLDEAAFGKAA